MREMFVDLVTLADGRSFAARHSGSLTYIPAVGALSMGDMFVLLRHGRDSEDRVVLNVQANPSAGITVIESDLRRP